MPKSETYTYTQTQQIHGFNAINRGVYIADNLPFLKSLNDECIDLVCIDPPFAKNETFTGERLKPPLTRQEKENELRLLKQWGIENKTDADKAGIAWPDESQGGYKDIWSWENDIHEEWMNQLDTNYEGISKVIDASRYVHGEDVAAYLCYMAIRLIEIHRVLKPTGSLYLHCDHTANGYLRQLLDGIFGKGCFRNEIVWHYYNVASVSRKFFGRKHDTIFFYSKNESNIFNWDDMREPYSQDSNWFKASESYSDARYRPDERGKLMHDVWRMPTLNNMSKQRTGYPTQKPVALAERIVVASTNPGDIVLDCFAGCAYAGVAFTDRTNCLNAPRQSVRHNPKSSNSKNANTKCQQASYPNLKCSRCSWNCLDTWLGVAALQTEDQTEQSSKPPETSTSITKTQPAMMVATRS